MKITLEDILDELWSDDDLQRAIGCYCELYDTMLQKKYILTKANVLKRYGVLYLSEVW